MSFGGSVQAMITSIKSNARARQDIFTKSKDGKDFLHLKKKPLEYKKVSNAELERIKDEIRLKAESEKRKIIFISIITAALIVSGLVYLLS